MMIVLTLIATAAVTYASSGQRSAGRSVQRVDATRFAESGLNAAYAVLSHALASGANPSAANLLGCAGATGPTDTTGPSDCSAPTPLLYCFGAPTCAAGAQGTAGVYGYFSGTSAGSLGGLTVPASSWLLVSTGYAYDPATGRIDSRTLRGMVKVSPLGAGAIAAVWNHVFVTAPLQPGVCALSFQGNSVTITAPLYVIGNLCLGSNGKGAVVEETTQPVDLQVGGKLVLVGGSTIGASSTQPITSGVVVGGCTTVSVTASTSPCSPTSFSYWVKNSETFVPNDAPAISSTQAAKDYASFDPGPDHPCAAGNNPFPPLASSVFDNDGVYTDSAATFELTPGYSDSCISQSGASVGELSWDNTQKKLTINGSIFFDGNLTISQSGTYTGSAVIESAGTITFNGNATQLCATSPCNTSSSAWQGSSGNNSMLTLVALANNTTSLQFTNNSQTFQGSVWTQPSANVDFVKNGVTLEGPMSIGSFDSTFNNATLIPLPVIKNMPVGAPLPPNSSASLSALQLIG